jgi:hypothetical protein
MPGAHRITVEPNHIQGINDGASFARDIRRKRLFLRIVLKGKFVADHLLVSGENGLPGDAGGRLFSGCRLCLSAHNLLMRLSALLVANFNRSR